MAQLVENPPPVVYKYRATPNQGDAASAKSFERDVRTLLVDRALFLASPLNLNDPFDCRPVFTAPTGNELESAIQRCARHFPQEQRAEVEMRARLLSRSRPHRRAFANEWYLKDLSKWGIVALSSKPDVPLLWSHYASEYRGYAVGYRAQTKGPNEALGVVNVTYSTERPVFNAVDDEENDPVRLFFNKSIE